jgi:hypothetical protein
MPGKRLVSESPNRSVQRIEWKPRSAPGYLFLEAWDAADGDFSFQCNAVRELAERVRGSWQADPMEGLRPLDKETLTDEEAKLLKMANECVAFQKAFISHMIHRRGEDSVKDKSQKVLGEAFLAVCLNSIDNLAGELNKITHLPERVRALSSLATTILSLFMYGNMGVPSISGDYFSDLAAEVARSARSEKSDKAKAAARKIAEELRQEAPVFFKKTGTTLAKEMLRRGETGDVGGISGISLTTLRNYVSDMCGSR